MKTKNIESTQISQISQYYKGQVGTITWHFGNSLINRETSDNRLPICWRLFHSFKKFIMQKAIQIEYLDVSSIRYGIRARARARAFNEKRLK